MKTKIIKTKFGSFYWSVNIWDNETIYCQLKKRSFWFFRFQIRDFRMDRKPEESLVEFTVRTRTSMSNILDNYFRELEEKSEAKRLMEKEQIEMMSRLKRL